VKKRRYPTVNELGGLVRPFRFFRADCLELKFIPASCRLRASCVGVFPMSPNGNRAPQTGRPHLWAVAARRTSVLAIRPRDRMSGTPRKAVLAAPQNPRCFATAPPVSSFCRRRKPTVVLFIPGPSYANCFSKTPMILCRKLQLQAPRPITPKAFARDFIEPKVSTTQSISGVPARFKFRRFTRTYVCQGSAKALFYLRDTTTSHPRGRAFFLLVFPQSEGPCCGGHLEYRSPEFSFLMRAASFPR